MCSQLWGLLTAAKLVYGTKGVLIAVGGRRTQYRQQGEAGGAPPDIGEGQRKQSVVEVIPTASGIPEADRKMSTCMPLPIWVAVKCNHAHSRKRIQKKDYFSRLEHADIVMLSGGNQARLSRAFLETGLLQLLQQRHQNDEHFVIAGTSAGPWHNQDI